MADSDLKEVDRIHKKLSEIHSYVRHTMQIVVTWFTFFGLVNFATLGWLAKSGAETTSRSLVVALSILFVIQNISAIITCLIMRGSMLQAHHDVLEYEKSIQSLVGGHSEVQDSFLPIKLYSGALLQMALALIPIASIWVLLLILK